MCLEFVSCFRGLVILLVGLLAASCPLAARGEVRTIQVVASLDPLAYFAGRIGGDDVHTEVLVPSGACLETYEPQLKQLRLSSRADIFIKVGHSGYSFETRWLDTLLASAPNVRVLDLSVGAEVSREDPHLWLSIKAVRGLVEQLQLALSEINPSRKDFYKERTIKIQRELGQMEAEFRELFSGDRGRTFFVFHPAWGHFAEQFGLRQLSVEQEGREPSPGSLVKVIQDARAHDVKVLFLQPGTVEENAKVVAEEIGGRTEILDPLNGDWFVNMRESAQKIKLGLGR